MHIEALVHDIHFCHYVNIGNNGQLSNVIGFTIKIPLQKRLQNKNDSKEKN